MGVYLVAAEKLSLDSSKGEVLIFRRGIKYLPTMKSRKDEESQEVAGRKRPHLPSGDGVLPGATVRIQQQTAIFHWKDVCYEVSIKGKRRVILDHIDGWVKPGTLTALMVISHSPAELAHDLTIDRVLLVRERRRF